MRRVRTGPSPVVPREIWRPLLLSRAVFDNLQRRVRRGATFGVAARIEDAAGRILLVRLQPGSWSPNWMTPGGGAERGESPQEAVLREIDEEAGVQVRGLRLWKLCHNRYEDPAGRSQDFDFYQFTARWRSGRPATRVPEEIAEVRWFSRLPANTEFRGDWLRPPRDR